jgi:hypothetical protein
MKLLGIIVPALVLFAAVGPASAETLEMANLVPADAKALIETVNAADLRDMLLKSDFWAALEQTQGVKEWRASQRYAEMQARLDQFLANLNMDKDKALKTYLGGRSAVVLLASPDPKKPWGVILTEATNEKAKQLVEASGAMEVKKYRGVAIYEVQKENRVDRMAFAGDVFVASSANGDALEKVLDVIVGGGASLGTEGHFAKAVEGLPGNWRARAYAAETQPRKSPGAVAVYPEPNGRKGRLHFEWRVISGEGDISMTAPVALTSPSALPDKAVVAVSSSFHPAAIWKTVKAKAEAQGAEAVEKLRRGEMFLRSWFPGQTTDTILAGLGPEGAMAILRGDGGAPSLLGMVKLTETGLPVARSFKDGLAAKAMLLAALSEKNTSAPKLNVREEGYEDAQLLIIEAPGVLEKFVGSWAKDIALTVAVTNNWVIIGTTPAGVKETVKTAAGKGTSLAKAMTDAGETVPTTPVTRWGVVQPADGAEIVLGVAERVAGTAKVEDAKKLINLAEMMKLVKRFLWTCTEEPTVIHGQADVQAIE